MDSVTRIGRSVVVTGDITSDEDIILDGEVHGYIHLRGATLTVGEHGRAAADIRAARVVVRGHVRGTVSASQCIELAATAVAQGGLSADQVILADGATFSGLVDMGRRTIAARLAQYRAAARETA